MGEEFDEAKAKIEKLKADLKLKTDLADNLRKAHGEQLIRKAQNQFVLGSVILLLGLSFQMATGLLTVGG